MSSRVHAATFYSFKSNFNFFYLPLFKHTSVCDFIQSLPLLFIGGFKREAIRTQKPHIYQQKSLLKYMRDTFLMFYMNVG